MSDVFISYARSTAADAQRVAGALRALGYEVWLDDQLPAHRAYADVIEERLRAAKAVVVIWSADAAKSEWVRSEAELAREGRKLVQLTVDGARLPMPFNQIQCADLSHWNGEADALAWRQVVNSVAELTGAAPAPEPNPATRPRPRPDVWSRRESRRSRRRSAAIPAPLLTPDEELHRAAVRRADAEIALRKQAIQFAVILGGLTVLNLWTSPRDLWIQWPAIGMGLLLASRGLRLWLMAHDGRRHEIIARNLRQMRPPESK